MKEEIKTPRWVDSLIDDLAPADFAEEIRGDLYEMFLNDFHRRSLRYARRRYLANALGFLAKRFFWKRSPHTTFNSTIMLQSYFRMAHRSLLAHRGTSLINIFGLVIGIASALAVFALVRYELSYNLMHSDISRIYRVVRVSGDGMSEFRTGVSYPVAPALKNEASSLAETTSMQYFGGAYVDVINDAGTSEAKFREESGCVVVQPNFFKVFDFKNSNFKWIEGNPDKAFDVPFSVVLTQSIAKKYFGDEKAVGRSIRFEKYYDAKITGVVTDFPGNTDFPFTILIAYSSLDKIKGSDGLDNWMSVDDDHQVFVKLSDRTTQAEAETQIAKVHAAHTPKEIHQMRHYLLQHISEVHHDQRFGNYSGRTISKKTVLALSLIALFLLVTAAINYVNLTTAQSGLRSKEIGLRKVLGSYRRNVVGQFLIETFVVVAIAGTLAFGLGALLLQYLSPLLSIHASDQNFFNLLNFGILFAIIFGLTLLAGFYPSVVLSRLTPVDSLKFKFNSGNPRRFSFRKVLVVTQFTLTQVLVVGTFIVVSQTRYFRNVNMGFDREAIVNLKLPATSTPANERAIAHQLASLKFASSISLSSTLPSGVRRNRSYMDVGRDDATLPKDYQVFEYEAIDPTYLTTYGIKSLAGRNVMYSDSVAKNVMINKTLAKRLQLGTPEEAVGKELKFGGKERATVVGVVDDFYSNSMKESVDNIVFACNPKAFSNVSIKLDLNNESRSLQEAIEQIGRIWALVYPEHIYNYDFFDDNVKAFYAQEEKYASLFQLFSIIFLVIGCLGLYGLVTFVVNRKGKEIAIRKVFGASVNNIMVMFSREYAVMILISFVLAAPVAYYAVDIWLSNFANHVELNWLLFTTPGLIVLIIALTVVVTKALAAARMTPTEKLKYE